MAHNAVRNTQEQGHEEAGVGKELAAQAEDPDWDLQQSGKRPGMVACVCDPRLSAICWPATLTQSMLSS